METFWCRPKPPPSCRRMALFPLSRRRWQPRVERSLRGIIVTQGIEAVAFTDLTTLADVKAWLQTGQAAFPATDDALLTRLITAASQYIQTWLNRPIALANYQEMRDGTGGCGLQFACFPVSTVLALTIDDQPVPAAPSST